MVELTTIKPGRHSFSCREMYSISSIMAHIVVVNAIANHSERSPGLAQETAGSGGINYLDYSIKCRRSLFSAYVMKDLFLDSEFVI